MDVTLANDRPEDLATDNSTSEKPGVRKCAGWGGVEGQGGARGTVNVHRKGTFYRGDLPKLCLTLKLPNFLL